MGSRARQTDENLVAESAFNRYGKHVASVLQR